MTSAISSGPTDVQRRAVPPPPPPPPVASPPPVTATADLERGRVAATQLGLGAPRQTPPPMPAAVDGPPADPYSAMAQAPEVTSPPSEGSTIGRFAEGLGTGVVAGVTGIVQGGVAAVTDPVGTARAIGSAVGGAAISARDYGHDLITSPRETIARTADSAVATARAIADAPPEAIGRFIGENAVGLVGGAGAGALVQRGARVAARARAVTPDAPRAPTGSLPPSPVARHGEAISRLGLDPTRVGRIADDLADELRRTGGASMGPATDAPRLAAVYGGTPSDWLKVSTSARQLDTAGRVTSLAGQTRRAGAPIELPNGPTTVDPTRGAQHVIEIHAYRHARTGQVVEPKVVVERTRTPDGLPSGRVADLPIDW